MKHFNDFTKKVDNLFTEVGKNMDEYAEVIGKMGDTMTGDVLLDGQDVQINGNLKGKTIDEIKAKQEMIINWVGDIAKAVNSLAKEIEELKNPTNVKL